MSLPQGNLAAGMLSAAQSLVAGRPLADEAVAAIEAAGANESHDGWDSVAGALGPVVTASRSLRVRPGEGFASLRGLVQSSPPSSPARAFFAYAAFHLETARLASERRFGVGARADYEALVPDLANVLDELERELPAAGAYELCRGFLASFSDREGARAWFKAAQSSGPAFMEALRFEQGSYTYFDEDELADEDEWSDEAALVRERLGRALAARPAAYQEPAAHLLWSVDPEFLRHYGPYWFNVAPFVLDQGFGLIFLVVGDEPAVAALADEARLLIERLAAFHRLREPARLAEAVTFVAVPRPTGVASLGTFYATARYLHAGDVVDVARTPVLVLDVDMSLRYDLAPAFERLRELDFACPSAPGMANLVPWRRFAAGTVYFGTTAEARALLTVARRYILTGISMPQAWMLDQNALAFLVDRGEAHISTEIPRPATQDRNRDLFTRRF